MRKNFVLLILSWLVLSFQNFLLADGAGTKWDSMDTGPFFTSGFAGKYPALKAISIKLGDKNDAAVCFDTELLRMTMGWTGGFLKLPTGRGGLEGIPEPVGTPIFWTPNLPGWAHDGNFTDPRPKRRESESAIPKKEADIPYGSLPKHWAHYNGLYLHREQVIFSYTVEKSELLEMPDVENADGLKIFSRTFQIEGSGAPMSLLVCEIPKGDLHLEKNSVTIRLNEGGTNESFLATTFVGAPEGTAWDTTDKSRIVLTLPKFRKTLSFKVFICSGAKVDFAKFTSFASGNSKIANLKSLCKGGPSHWGEPLSTRGVLGKEDGPYQVDTLTLPENNPWKSWIRPSGFDFFSDGRAALCSVSGDIWIISGIDDKLDKIAWQRFATGLFQPLGLKIVKDKVYVTGRDQITCLHDLNHDGEADFYENFNNDVFITSHYHEFALNLDTDSKGNFYFTKGGNLEQAVTPHQGTLLKVSKDGSKIEVVANGLRAPNGLSVGPHDEIMTSDNEGNWVPASRVNLMKPGKFYGHVFNSHTDQPPIDFEKPLLWIPHNNNIDNSSGGQVWVTSDKWGPFKNQLLHLSYGTCSLFEVMQENVEGQPQAGVVKFPLKFESGVMRGRFNKQDGQLYLCGLSVWQSNAGKEGTFQRVRYTGKTVNMPCELHVLPTAIQLTFTAPLNVKSASDSENYGIEQWNYRWTADYGSPEFSVKNPNEKTHDPVEIKSVQLSSDKKTVTLEIADLHPVMQMKIKYNINAADGSPLKQEIYNTINRVPSVGLSKLSKH